MESLASWASRYSELNPVMKNHVTSLHASTKGYKNRNSAIDLSPHARQDIRMWRAYLVATHLDHQRLARKLESFRPMTPTVVIQFDACLTGAGVIIRGHQSVTWEYGFATHFPFDVQQSSSYQNTSEFLAVLVGVYLTILTHGPGQRIQLIGDSTAALNWAEKLAFRGVLARRAAAAFTLLCLTYDVDVVGIMHVPGTENVICDDLSRIRDTEDVLQSHGIPSLVNVDVSGVRKLMVICNPLTQLETDVQFVELWAEVSHLVTSINTFRSLNLD